MNKTNIIALCRRIAPSLDVDIAYDRAIAELDAERDAGAIDAETYVAAIERAVSRRRRAMRDARDGAPWVLRDAAVRIGAALATPKARQPTEAERAREAADEEWQRQRGLVEADEALARAAAAGAMPHDLALAVELAMAVRAGLEAGVCSGAMLRRAADVIGALLVERERVGTTWTLAKTAAPAATRGAA